MIVGGVTGVGPVQAFQITIAVLASGVALQTLSHHKQRSAASVSNQSDVEEIVFAPEEFASPQIGLKNGLPLRKNESLDSFKQYHLAILNI